MKNFYNAEDLFWLWGHGRQTDNLKGKENPDMRGRPGFGRLSTAEAAREMGISNICRIALEDAEQPPFDIEAEEGADMKKIAWSILGCGHGLRNDLDEVLRMARKYPNITAGVMDDFFLTASKTKMERYTPEILGGFAARLHSEAKRRLDLWVVVYSGDLEYNIKAYVDQCDVVTFWTYSSKNLVDLEENYNRLRKICGEDKPIMAGCYMWDFPARSPVPADVMEYQLEIYDRWIREGRIEGVIFCHNYLVDLPIDAVGFTKEWIRKFKAR